MKKSKDTVEISTALLMNIMHIMSYAEGYITGIGKPDVYISDQTNCVVNDIMRLFEQEVK